MGRSTNEYAPSVTWDDPRCDKIKHQCRRVPFDNLRKLVEWAMTLPGSHKVRNGTGKLVLREALRAELPMTSKRRPW